MNFFNILKKLKKNNWQKRNRQFAAEEAFGLHKAAPNLKLGLTHNQEIRDIADLYAGRKLNHNLPVAEVDQNRAKNIANAYHVMEHTPNHPETQKSYGALVDETKKQFHHLQNHGFRFSKITPDMENPYKTSKDLFKDISDNKHVWYFPTESGFGSGDSYKDHPLLQKFNDKHGNEIVANDAFRIVHDVFGHAKEGHGFGPKGEENAWQHHMQMFSPDAQKALTSETRGQNSWVNFGPHGENNRANPAKTIYADQKAGLLPDWAMASGPAGIKKSVMKTIGDLEKGLKGDWQKEGYTLQHEEGKFGNKRTHKIIAYKDGKKVGSANFVHGYDDKTINPSYVNVDKDHRRKGLATAMYNLAEEKSNRKVLEIPLLQSGDAKKLWSQPDRPFGKPFLRKGMKGDWRKEGYTLSTLDEDTPYPEVLAHDKNGRVVGNLLLRDERTHLFPSNVNVDPQHRRKGLATAMYQHAEERFGKKIKPSDMQTSDGESLWSQPQRPFGKSSLQKGKRGDWQKEGYTLEHEKDGTTHTITAYDKAGNEAGFASFGHAQDNTILPLIANVEKEHQRKGLATAMYKLAEEKSGRKVFWQPQLQSKQAKKFWNQPDRPFGQKTPFGKSSLEKGAMSRLAPNPENLGDEHKVPTRQWAHVGMHEDRTNIPRLEGDNRKRMLHKLSGMTAVKVGEDGKRQFLLHRGVAQHELKNFANGESNYHKSPFNINSWSTSHNIAHQFSNSQDPEKTKSLWVHEDDIHSMPRMVASKDMSNRLKNENEVIVKHTRPYKEVPFDQAFKTALPYSGYKRETTLPIEADDGYIDEIDQSDVNYRINRGIQRARKSVEEFEKVTSGRHTEAPGQPQKTMTKPAPDKKHIRADTQNHMDFKLEKGVARKIAPYSPKKGMTEESARAQNWVVSENQVTREHFVPKHEGPIKFRALNKLSNYTKSRKNPETGELEFLLHRGMHENELERHENKIVTNKTSWTPHLGVAADFAKDYSDVGAEPTHVVSAWIPAKHMHSFPFMMGYDPHIQGYKNESEVIVDPHKINIHGIEHWQDAKHKALGIEATRTKADEVRKRIRQNLSPKVVKKSAAGYQLISGGTGIAALQKSTEWHVKIKGIEGYHPLANIQDLGPEKGNNYILKDGREFHQSLIEDMIPAPKFLKKGDVVDFVNKDKTVKQSLGRPFYLVENLKSGKEGYWVNYKNKNGTHDIHYVDDNGIKPVKINSNDQLFGDKYINPHQVDDYVLSTKILSHLYENAPPPKEDNVIKFSKSIEPLEKARPSYVGEVDHEKENIAVQHPFDKRDIVWSHSPKKAKAFQNTIDKNLDKFASQFGEHAESFRAGVSKILANKKHADLVPTSLKRDNIHTPRRRHVAFLVSGHPDSQIKHLGNGEFLWRQDRHAEGGYDPETWWKMNSQGIQDVTRQYIGKAKEIFGKSDKHIGGIVNEIKKSERREKTSNSPIQKRSQSPERENSFSNEYQAVNYNNGAVRFEGYSRFTRGAGSDPMPAGRSGSYSEAVRKISSPVPKKLAKSDLPQVASIAVVSGNHILMGKRNDNQRWTLPGGHLNGGEDPLTGAKRELLEETGIHVNDDDVTYLGSEQVETFTGKKLVVHCFAVIGEYDTDTELDPDNEVQHWYYVDISSGLPKEVAENLHSPKNCLLRKLGLQKY